MNELNHISIPQMHFAFKDWEACFVEWDANVSLYGSDSLQLVVSHHWASEGYWIEKRGTETRHERGMDFVYTGKKVAHLRGRVKRSIDAAKLRGGIGTGLIT